VRGERPLWDFPDGTLAGREVAAYLVSAASGWDLVPPTVLRDGPFGAGACQLWIDEPADAEPVLGFVPADEVPAGWHAVVSARTPDGTRLVLAHSDDPRLARMAAYDAVVNNADRKGGHVLTAPGDRLFGVDHGVCFHTEDKLRTVLWGWAGAPLPADVVESLDGLRAALDGDLGGRLAEHLTATEVAAVRHRLTRLAGTGRFPRPDHDRRPVPWPPV